MVSWGSCLGSDFSLCQSMCDLGISQGSGETHTQDPGLGFSGSALLGPPLPLPKPPFLALLGERAGGPLLEL